MTWLETAQGIITLISGGLALLATLVTLSISLYKACKQIAKDRNWKKVMEVADAAIQAAEKSGKSGADKKTMVIEAVQASCLALGIEVDLSQLGTYIDECIEFANKLNGKK